MTALQENDKTYFFGVYAANDSSFKFLNGDRKLIKAAAKKINDIRGSRNLENFQSYFAMPEEYVISNVNIIELPIGTFFGKKSKQEIPQGRADASGFKFLNIEQEVTQPLAENADIRSSQNYMDIQPYFAIPKEHAISNVKTMVPVGEKKLTHEISQAGTEKMAMELFEKVQKMFQHFLGTGLTLTRPISKDILNILNSPTGIIAHVTCVFCIENTIDQVEVLKKTFSVFGEKRGNKSHSWNCGYLKKHLERHRIDHSLADPLGKINIEAIPVVLEKSDDDGGGMKSLEFLTDSKAYEQTSTQNVTLTEMTSHQVTSIDTRPLNDQNDPIYETDAHRGDLELIFFVQFQHKIRT